MSSRVEVTLKRLLTESAQIEYELTWVRVGIGYALTWVQVGIGYELTGTQMN